MRLPAWGAAGALAALAGGGAAARRVVEEPLLMAHDAAMAYLANDGSRHGECREFKTQSLRPGGPWETQAGLYPSALSSLLDCGARALDLRVGTCAHRRRKRRPLGLGSAAREEAAVGAMATASVASAGHGADDESSHNESSHNESSHNESSHNESSHNESSHNESSHSAGAAGIVCLHHGGAWLEHITLESELPSILRWSRENAGELVVLKLVPDGGSDGDPALRAALLAALELHGVPSVDNAAREGCWGSGRLGPARPWSLLAARAHRVVAAWKYDVGDTGQPDASTSCVEDNYVPSIGFNPFEPERSFAALQQYATNVVHNQFAPRGPDSPQAVLQEVQLIWQTFGTALYYELVNYDLLAINQASGLNRWLADNYTRAPLFRAANLVKMNNLCAHGMAVADNLGTRVSPQQRERCIAACGGLNAPNLCVARARRPHGP
jgi:hypothetical protein